MKDPKQWTLGAEHYSYRVQFDFVDETGTLIKTKTWEVRRKHDDPPQLLCLQLSAKVGAEKPRWEDVATNFLKITTPIEFFSGELKTVTFEGFLSEDQLHQVLASAPLTMGVVVDGNGMHLTLHTAKTKKQ